MAIKISDMETLPSALDGTEYIPVVKAGVNYKIALTSLVASLVNTDYFTTTAGQSTYSRSALNGAKILYVIRGSQVQVSDLYSPAAGVVINSAVNNFTLTGGEVFDGEQIIIVYSKL